MIDRPCCSRSLARAKTASAPSPLSSDTRVAMFGMARKSYHCRVPGHSGEPPSGSREAPLKRQAQRKLDQARRAGGGKDFAERTVRNQAGRGAAIDAWGAQRRLDVVDRWIGEVRVVPHVEEVRSEAQIEAFGDREVLQDREVPTLLVGSAESVAAEVAEDRHGSVAALSRRERRSNDKLLRVQIAIQPAVNPSACVGAGDGGPRRQGSRECRRVAGREECGPRSRIENREGCARLDDGDTADRPAREDLLLPAIGGREERQIIAVTQCKTLRAVEVG